MRKLWIAAAAVAMLITPALAVDGGPVPTGMSIRVGGFFPGDGGARDSEGDTWLGGGFDWKLPMNLFPSAPGTVGEYRISVDFFEKGSYRHIPIMVNYKGTTDRFYYLVGAGISITRSPGSPTTVNKTVFGYQFGVGIDIMPGPLPIFVEAKFLGSTRSEVNGFTVCAGVRF